ncbi:MAG TPA: class I SAM-dependent methyltransferase [bacterium]|nr:class I SAM-dependent methyltransferase [bacterium]
MNKTSKVRNVFDAWAADHHANGMENEHWDTVRQAFEWIPSGKKHYLEIGVGNGYGVRYMAAHQFARGFCHGIDISPVMIRRAGEKTSGLQNVSLETADFLQWSPSDGIRFDVIFSMEVFYYFTDIQKGLDRAFRFLAPGGMLMVLVEYYSENPFSHGWPAETGAPMSLWSEEHYREGFDHAGFQKIRQGRLLKPGPRKPDHDAGTLITWGVKSSAAAGPQPES